MQQLELLTRTGCANTPLFRRNLEEALLEAEMNFELTMLDIGELKNTDYRQGYPTPTLLYKGRDLYGMAEPLPPFPDPG